MGMGLEETASYKSLYLVLCTEFPPMEGKKPLFSLDQTALGMQTTFIKTKENTPVNCCKNGEREAKASGKATGCSRSCAENSSAH